MRQHGLDVLVPNLKDSSKSKEPFWKQHVHSVSQALAHIARNTHLTLIAHSGAGPLLPVIRQSLPQPVNAYVFVDAGIPRAGATRLDLMRSEDPEWAGEFQEHLEGGGVFPTWSFDDLQEVIPDEDLRKRMVDKIQPRGLTFFTEPIPVFNGWPDASCVYIKFSSPYEYSAAQARQAGWTTYELDAGHFHMLVDPQAVANLIVEAVKRTT